MDLLQVDKLGRLGACKNWMLFTEKMFCLQTMKDERDGCDDDEDDDDDILMNHCWI